MPCSEPVLTRFGRKRFIVILRYDDFSSNSATDLEIKLIDAFRKHNVSCTFGVIPFANPHGYYGTDQHVFLAPEKSRILIEASKSGTVEVALHGYTHKTVRNRHPYGLTEFQDVDSTQQ